MSKVLLVQTICSHRPLLAKLKALFPETCQTCLQSGFVSRESTQPGPTPALLRRCCCGPPFCTSLGAKQGAGAENSRCWWWWMACKIQLRSTMFATQRISMEWGHETCLYQSPPNFLSLCASCFYLHQQMKTGCAPSALGCSLSDHTPQAEPGVLHSRRTIRLLHLCPRQEWVAFMC